MSFIIKTAKTVEEAIQAGLIELGLERNEVDVEVIEEPKSGFLGLLGQKDAMVKIKKKEDISSFVRDILYDDKTVGTKEELPKEEIITKPKEEPVEAVKEVEDRVEKIETQKVEIKEEIIIEEETDDKEDFDENELTGNGRNIEEIWTDIEIKNNAEEFLTKIINEFDINYHLIVELKDQELFVEIKSQNPSDLGIVIGKHGSTLDSLQYLLSQVINKHKEDFIRVTVDANEYRDKRKRNLEKIAKRSVEKVQRFGRPIKLEPMNAADRRIVHMILQNYDDINTHSEGKDPFRRVVISRAKKAR
ncbi:MAG: KH domain-containing protein [Tissierellia bacterium]|jgi:spoIIIJ-associated protein|nr:KH domain-containing protein [Tissierellia bacterium]